MINSLILRQFCVTTKNNTHFHHFSIDSPIKFIHYYIFFLEEIHYCMNTTKRKSLYIQFTFIHNQFYIINSLKINFSAFIKSDEFLAIKLLFKKINVKWVSLYFFLHFYIYNKTKRNCEVPSVQNHSLYFFFSLKRHFFRGFFYLFFHQFNNYIWINKFIYFLK